MNWNSVQLAGNLTRDPSLKYLPSQTPVTEFGVAVNRRFKTESGEDREEVTFVDCTAFGKIAENINKFFTKGKPIFIDGRLKYDQWEDKQGGGKRSKLTVVVNNFQFLPNPNREPEAGGAEHPTSRPGREEQRGRAGLPDQAPAPRKRWGTTSRPAAPEEPPFSSDQQFAETDIPFTWEGRRQPLA